MPGSVRTPSLCALESHPTVHHLVSTVTGDLRADCDALDLLAATFPGGGITARSIPTDEYQESLDKARALLAAIVATR